MTIEQLLTALIASIDANTAATIAQKIPPVHTPVHTPVHQPNQTVTAEDLQTFCTNIVRKDRTKKAQIVAILAEYKAKLISDIPALHYGAIRASLEKLL